jgi:putative N6-adenine-specific DNA methylase
MKGLALTQRGVEDVTSLELKELICAKTEIHDGFVLFEFKKLEALATLCYTAQSVRKVLFLLNSCTFEQLNSVLENIEYKEWMDDKTTFRVSCEVHENGVDSSELAKKAGGIIFDAIERKLGFTPTVNLESPQVTFYILVQKNICYIGVDVSGKDLSKREYKIFGSQNSIKGTIAYALLRAGDYKAQEVLLDPFCKSGEIVIEAALFASQLSVNYYSKEDFSFVKLKLFKDLDSKKLFEKIDAKISKQIAHIYAYDSDQKLIIQAKKNAKIAGIQKEITFSRQNLEWIDLKQKEKAVDKIITYPPQLSKKTEDSEIEKKYHEFFYQAEYILKDNGLIVMLTKDTELLQREAAKYKIVLKDKKEIWMGEQQMYIAVFEKKIN